MGDIALPLVSQVSRQWERTWSRDRIARGWWVVAVSLITGDLGAGLLAAQVSRTLVGPAICIRNCRAAVADRALHGPRLRPL
jgi:hypothetical protein